MPMAASFEEFSHLATRDQANAAGLDVVCAWPVSGQYGPGSRVLYYVLVATCIFARKAEWLRNPCLAAALLLPAVAALHGIVLAATDVVGAVDMDIYGAFQVCAIGILAAPVTVSQSTTYYDAPGRNTIFAWSSLILAGLISLTVQFYRSMPTFCKRDDLERPLSPNPSAFPYGQARCGLLCNLNFPKSPIRGGSANNIYIIPAPTLLSFNTAMLLSAACCIPTVLLLVNMWLKILENNAKKFHGGDTINLGEIKKHNRIIALIRKYFEVPFFGGAILAILIIGERNLFSSQVRHQTEPLANIGQWGPIVGTGLAVLGSGYVLLAQAVVREQREPEPPGRKDIIRRMARTLMRFSNWVGIPNPDRFDTGSEFREVRQRVYPLIPGEENRVGQLDLNRVQSGYDQHPGDVSPLDALRRSRSRSRAATFRSTAGGATIEETPTTPQTESPTVPQAEGQQRRRPTLEVPSSNTEWASGRHGRTLSEGSQASVGSTAREPPVIRVTTMEETASPEHIPIGELQGLESVPKFPQLPAAVARKTS